MRLIDADALISKIEKRYIGACIQVKTRRSGKGVQRGIALGMNRARNEISEQPTIDAVPVVRCKDCKHTVLPHFYPDLDADTHRVCNMMGRVVPCDGFCYKGKKMEGCAEHENA